MNKEQEGVIKYSLLHTFAPLSPQKSLAEINCWRQIMRQLELIGQNDLRYDGLGFGNISLRLSEESFIISGTQTGEVENLSADQFAIVDHAEPQLNRIKSHGLRKPSSEALTHAMVYEMNRDIQAIIHVHTPIIWRNTPHLNLAFTDKNVAYGTPAMAEAVAELLTNKQLHTQGLFTMLGHEDGVMAFGADLKTAAYLIIDALSNAMIFEENHKTG